MLHLHIAQLVQGDQVVHPHRLRLPLLVLKAARPQRADRLADEALDAGQDLG
jgi:hypothetical protein